MVASIFINWMIGMLPGVFLRFVVFKQASSKRKAKIATAIIAFCLFMMVSLVSYGMGTTPNMAPVAVWTFATYAILRYDASRRAAQPQPSRRVELILIGIILFGIALLAFKANPGGGEVTASSTTQETTVRDVAVEFVKQRSVGPPISQMDEEALKQEAFEFMEQYAPAADLVSLFNTLDFEERQYFTHILVNSIVVQNMIVEGQRGEASR